MRLNKFKQDNLYIYVYINLEYAFYIDSKGNRLFSKFLIEWEGTPESFAFSYPFIMAFDSCFIEIRNVITVSINIVDTKNKKLTTYI